MSTNAKDIKQMLQDILERFLEKEESALIFGELCGKSELPLNFEDVTGSINRNQIAFGVDHAFFCGSQIDLLITTMELRLPAEKYCTFLLELGQLAITSGELRLAVDIHNIVLKQTRDNPLFTEIAANATFALGSIYRKEAEWDKSTDFAEKAKQLYDKCGSNIGKAKCENLLGNIKGDCGDLDSAKYHYKKSLSLIPAGEDLYLTAALETNLGIICNVECQFEESLKYFKGALDKFTTLGDKVRTAIVYHNLGMVHLQKNDYAPAIEEFDRSIAVSAEVNNLPNMGMSYLSKAYLYAKIKDHLLATAYADKALEICNKVNDKLSIAEIYKVKGIINKNLKNYTLSESYFLTSLRINRELNNALNEAETMFEAALLYKDINRTEDALKFLLASKQYYSRIRSGKDVEKIDKIISGF